MKEGKTVDRSSSDIINATNEKTQGKAFKENPWGLRHVEAWDRPRGPEVSIVSLIRAWGHYADVHRERYQSPIGEDGVLGAEWARIGAALLGLLNGELGRLDGGTLDGLIRAIASANAIDLE